MIKEYWGTSDRCLLCEAYEAGHPKRPPVVDELPQNFYESTANAFFPQGCTCPDDSGTCDWCSVYYDHKEKKCS